MPLAPGEVRTWNRSETHWPMADVVLCQELVTGLLGSSQVLNNCWKKRKLCFLRQRKSLTGILECHISRKQSGIGLSVLKYYSNLGCWLEMVLYVFSAYYKSQKFQRNHHYGKKTHTEQNLPPNSHWGFEILGRFFCSTWASVWSWTLSGTHTLQRMYCANLSQVCFIFAYKQRSWVKIEEGYWTLN